MSKIYVADKETLDKIYNILATEPVYGFIEHNAILAPGSRIEYIGLNKNYSPIEVTMGGGFTLNEWAEFPWLKGNKPWMVKADGSADYRLNEDDYSKKEDGSNSDVANTSYNGGAFAWCPKIYKREYTVGDDRYVLFRFEKADGFEAVGFIDSSNNELEGVWIPMFYGSIVSDKMRSTSNLQPDYGKATAAQKTAIDAFGSRARFFGGPIICTLIDLEIMFAKTTDLQTAYGKGNCSGYDASIEDTHGVLKNAVVGGGLFYGTDDGTSLNKIFHSIVLGSYQQYMRDPYTLVINGRFKVSKNYAYALDGSGYLDTGIDVPQPSAAGWAYPHRYRSVPGFGHLPTSPYNGSSATGGCDGLYRSTTQSSMTAVALRFGDCNDGLCVGGRCVRVDHTAPVANWAIGSALLLLPPVGASA